MKKANLERGSLFCWQVQGLGFRVQRVQKVLRIQVAALPLVMNSLPLEGKVPRRGG